MSDQRPVFRFRLPWLASSAPAQAPSPPRAPAARPATDIQIPTRPTTVAPVVRPPFRPAGVAPQPPPPPPPRPFRVVTPPRTGPQPSSASQAGAQTQEPTQLSSPARAAVQGQVPFPPPPPPPPPSQIEAQPRRVEPQPSLQSLFGPQTRIASQPTSPAQTATQSAASQPPPPPSTESTPSSPSRVGSQLSSSARAVSQPPPPLPPPVQESPRRIESQQSPSSYRTGAQNERISSPQASPARAGTQSQAASQPPPRNQSHPNSPSRFGAQTRVPSQPLSPAKASIQASQARTASQAASPARVFPQPQAPSKPSSPARPNPRAASQAASPSLTRAQPRAASPLSPLSQATPLKDEAVAQLPPPPRTVQPTTQTRISPPPDSGKDPSNPMVVQSQAPVKDIDANHVEPKKHSVIELLTEASSRLKEQTKELSTFAFQENHAEKQESLGTKETVPTMSFGDKQAKPVFSRSKDRNTVIDSHQKPSAQKYTRDDISMFVNKVSNGNTNDNDNKKNLSVITISGDNRGATMTLGSSKRERAVNIYRGYKLNPDENTESTTDGEGTSKGKKISKDKAEDNKKSYINNNSQGINNSIVFNSSITEHNPGVHMVISRTPKELNKSNDRIESLLRAEMNFTPSQKLTYEPTIRRRCLRGLMMEPSDSDNDSLEKPRRHGCLYARSEMRKDDNNNIDVL